MHTGRELDRIIFDSGDAHGGAVSPSRAAAKPGKTVEGVGLMDEPAGSFALRTVTGTRLLLQCVACAATLAELRQVVLLRQLFDMRLDGVSIGACRLHDLFDGDFAAGLCEFENLPG